MGMELSLAVCSHKKINIFSIQFIRIKVNRTVVDLFNGNFYNISGGLYDCMFRCLF